MLNKDVLMADIDVDQWRNAQELVLESAKERRRIVVLHDLGTVRKVTHSHGSPIHNRPGRVGDPRETARALFEANAGTTDFVAVFERSAFDAYFAAVQDSWNIDEDLDVFVQRTYALLDDYPDGMVTHPAEARSTLGLQWRLGASRDEVLGAVANFVEPASTIVVGVFSDHVLWASLVLTFDASKSVIAVTTVDPAEVDLSGDMQTVSAAVVDWVRTKHGPCSLGLFLQRQHAEAFLATTHKASVLRAAAAADCLVLNPVPSSLALALA